jgi:hypothetical protein
MSNLTVITDPRLRALSALLAATDWPDREQRPLPRGVHPQAAMLRRHVSPFRAHSAALYAQSVLDADPDPAPLFARVLADDPALSGHLLSFAGTAGLAAFWAEHEPAWAQAVGEVQAQLHGLPIAEFLAELGEAPPAGLCVHPNIAYPTTHSFGLLTGGQAWSILPPRKAVGESKPWPFGDDRDYVARLVIHDVVQAQLLALTAAQAGLIPLGENNDRLPAAFRAEFPGWPRQVIELFAYAAQILFLNRLDDGAGDAFMVFERRTRGLAVLPGVVDAVSNYLTGRGLSPVYAGLAAYLPHFADEVDRLLSDSKT